MKKIISLAVAAVAALQVSAQSAFTVQTKDTTYSFPITSKITLTDNELWKPDTVKVEKTYKSNYARLEASFRGTFATATQQLETGVESFDGPHLIDDYLWELDFNTNEYKRVQLMVKAYNSATSETAVRNILANKSNTQENLGSCNLADQTGNYFNIRSYGKEGRWAWIYNELTNTFALVNRDAQQQMALDLSSLTATADKTLTKDLNINNVSGKWKFKALVDDGQGGTKDTLIEWKITSDAFSDRYWTTDGIPYKSGTGRVKVNYHGFEILGEFPDEDHIANGHDWDFHFVDEGLSTEEYQWKLKALEPNTSDSLFINYPDFTIQDRNTLVSTNGMELTQWSQTRDSAGNKPVVHHFIVPAGTTMRRSSTYPDDVTTIVHDTVFVVKHDTIYIEKHDTIEIKNLTAKELIAAGTHAKEVLNSTTHIYDFASDDEFKEYASYYKQAAAVTDTTVTSKEEWQTAIAELQKVETAYGFYCQKLMNQASTGKYLCLGQGAIGATAFNSNFKMKLTDGAYYNSYTKSNSGYVAFAKYGVSVNDSTVFATTFNKNPKFDGLETVDVYVIYNPCNEKPYFPAYIAEGNGFTLEQWKGNTANFYSTLEEAVAHLGKSTANLADRVWVKLNYSDEGTRTVIAAGTTDMPDLSAYTDFEVVTTCESCNVGGRINPGVTVDASAWPFTYTKDGESCEFSGVMILKANNTDGDKVAIVVFKNSTGKYYAYSFDIDD